MDKAEAERIRDEAIEKAWSEYEFAENGAYQNYQDALESAAEYRDEVIGFVKAEYEDNLDTCEENEPLSDRIVDYVLNYLGNLQYDDFCKFYVGADDVDCLKFGVIEMLDNVEEIVDDFDKVSWADQARGALSEILCVADSVCQLPYEDASKEEAGLDDALDLIVDIASEIVG